MSAPKLPGDRLSVATIALLVFIAATPPVDAPPCTPKTTKPGELTPKQMREWGVAMPQISFCTSDLDCAGCTSCRNGFCDQAQWSGTMCMCDDECLRIGQNSCDRPLLKPLCGGQCSKSAARLPLPCGRGQDTPRVETFEGQACRAAATAEMADPTIAIELSSEPQP